MIAAKPIDDEMVRFALNRKRLRPDEFGSPHGRLMEGNFTQNEGVTRIPDLDGQPQLVVGCRDPLDAMVVLCRGHLP